MTNHLTARASINTASIGYLRALFDHVRARGLDPETLWAGHRADLEDRDARITEAECAALFDRAAALLNDDDLGLHAGETIRPGHYGALGYVAMNCATLGEALACLRRYHALVLDIGPMTESLERGHLSLSWNPAVEHPYRQMAEFNLAGLVSFARWISGRADSPLRIDFTYPPPQKLDEHRRIFGCPLRFGHDCYRLVMTSGWLTQPLIQPDPAMRLMMERMADRQMQALARGDDVLARARGLLARGLGHDRADLQTLARQLEMTPRTLQRKLQDAQLSYSQLVDDVRRELAENYIGDPALDLTDIAFLLGYSEQSAFTRAYKRWTGQAPKTARDEKKTT